MSIGIVDVGIGNIGSLYGALFSQGWDIQIVTAPRHLSEVSHLILPGVGSFATAMKRLNDFELIQPLRAYAASGRPLMGICLGMQILADCGDEGGGAEGLGLISGGVIQFDHSSRLRFPHVGWNLVHPQRPHPVLKGIPSNVDFYFVHNYIFRVNQQVDIIGVTDYGLTFPSIVGRDNVVGTQFHPEKSQRNGLRLLDNFCLWDGSC